jgi:hypothetical protein
MVSLLATGVVTLYTPFLTGFGIKVGLNTVVVTVILFSFINFSIRVASYGYLSKEPDYSTETMERRKRDNHNAIFSFMIGVWFLLFLNIGANIGNGDILYSYDIGSINIVNGLLYSLLIVATPAVLACVSEMLLWRNSLIEIPDALID